MVCYVKVWCVIVWCVIVWCVIMFFSTTQKCSFYFFSTLKMSKRRRMCSADRPTNIEVNFFHLLPRSSHRLIRHASSLAVQGPEFSVGSRKLTHRSLHCILLRINPMLSETRSHVLSFLSVCFDTIYRSLRSSSSDQGPFLTNLLSGRKL